MKKIEINEVSINLKSIIEDYKEITLKINHNFTNTFIDLSELSNVKLTFFDVNGIEINRMRINEKSAGPFFILTQAKRIRVFKKAK